ncbi:MAG: GEVED domain-containing protein, partial [Bacteroidota bacterium]
MFDTYPSPVSPCPGSFTLNGNINQPCTGTPSPGNTIASTSAACIGASVNLSLQTATSGTGVTYQWQSSANPTGPWSNFGTSASTQSAVVAGVTYYRSVVTCTGSGLSGTSNPVLVSTLSGTCTCGPYPNVFASSTSDEEITNVTVGNMNNSSSCATTASGPGSINLRYSNYTNSVSGPSVEAGQSVSFSLTQTSCGGPYGNGFQIYIDFNQNGSFADAGEQVYSQPVAATGNHTKTGSFIVPVNATIGSTRMRVVNVETGFPTTINYAQTGYTFGETEDYCFTVLPPPPCAGTPNPGNSIASVSSGCSGTTVALSLQNPTTGTGVTYQWQSSASPTGPWSNISNGTSFNASISISGTLYYQCVVTCSGSGQSGTSNPVLITQLTGTCNCATYPNVFASNTLDEEITNVTVGTMNNSSTCATTAPGPGSINKRYSNYTGSIAGPSAQQGDVVSFSLTQTSCGGVFANGFQIYIDYNQNGSFADAGEQVYSQPVSVLGNHTQTGTFTIPPSALVGTTRMRVVNVELNFPTTVNYAQTGYTYGETEDYCFTVLAPPPCTGTPNPG